MTIYWKCFLCGCSGFFTITPDSEIKVVFDFMDIAHKNASDITCDSNKIYISR